MHSKCWCFSNLSYEGNASVTETLLRLPAIWQSSQLTGWLHSRTVACWSLRVPDFIFRSQYRHMGKLYSYRNSFTLVALCGEPKLSTPRSKDLRRGSPHTIPQPRLAISKTFDSHMLTNPLTREFPTPQRTLATAMTDAGYARPSRFEDG